jgi:hypothetical protein
MDWVDATSKHFTNPMPTLRNPQTDITFQIEGLRTYCIVYAFVGRMNLGNGLKRYRLMLQCPGGYKARDSYNWGVRILDNGWKSVSDAEVEKGQDFAHEMATTLPETVQGHDLTFLKDI